MWAEHTITAWPHDGLQHEKGRDAGVQQMEHYKEAGFKMCKEHASWPSGVNTVEDGLYELNDLMMKGKLKFFNGLRHILDEVLQYHRDEKGKIVKTNDDCLDSLRYAYMMRRRAIRYGDRGQKRKKAKPKRMSIA